jgi:hypothetical protein
MADISLLRQIVPEPPTEAYLRYAVASNYWMNPICGQCYDKSNPGKLFPCNLCGLTFYCSNKCQTAHKEKHKARCCSANGPLDDGPMQLVVIHAKIKEQPLFSLFYFLPTSLVILSRAPIFVLGTTIARSTNWYQSMPAKQALSLWRLGRCR